MSPIVAWKSASSAFTLAVSTSVQVWHAGHLNPRACRRSAMEATTSALQEAQGTKKAMGGSGAVGSGTGRALNVSSTRHSPTPPPVLV